MRCSYFKFFKNITPKKLHIFPGSITVHHLSVASDANDSHIRVSVTFGSRNVDNLSLRNGIWVPSRGTMFIPSFVKFWLESLNGGHISKQNTHIAWWFQKPAFSFLKWDVGKEIHRVLVFFVSLYVCVHIHCVYCVSSSWAVTTSYYDPYRPVPTDIMLICVSHYWLTTKFKTFKDDRTITALLTVLVSLVMKTK